MSFMKVQSALDLMSFFNLTPLRADLTVVLSQPVLRRAGDLGRALHSFFFRNWILTRQLVMDFTVEAQLDPSSEILRVASSDRPT